MKTPPTTARALCALGLELSDEQLLSLTDSEIRIRLKRWLDRAERRKVQNTFAVPMLDEDAVLVLIQQRKLSREAAETMVAAWRKLATELGYTGPIAWQVKAGFTLKQHGPKAGPCYQNWSYLQDWQLQNDDPTVASIVLWIPRLLNGSTGKNVTEQEMLRADTRTRLALPAHHLKDFGSAALLAALIQAHAKRTGERTPLNGFYARTDTLHVGGYRLSLDWNEGELHCDVWYDSERHGNLGAFPLGVEALGISGTPPSA